MAAKELSLTQSILQLKCPRCRVGDLFISNSHFNYKLLTKMPTHCPICNQNYLPEPGFYYGAMFVSYIMCSFWFLGFIAICMFVFKLSVNTSFALLMVMVAILFGWIFRISRSLWIHFNIKYQPQILVNKGNSKETQK